MVSAFKITGTLPRRNGYRVLKEQILEWIKNNDPSVGSPFLSDEQLVRLSGLSRMTVRKALGELRDEGWLTRQQGRGTFIGLRPAIPGDANTSPLLSTLRVAVLVRYLSDLEHDWYSVPIMRGLSQSAEREQITVEILGDHENVSESLIRRLTFSAPDVLIALAPQGLNHWRVIAEATRLGMKVLRAGYASPDFAIPVVCCDGIDSSRQAVRYLADRGHERIAFAQIMQPEPWIIDRYFGWKQGLVENGLPDDDNLALWLHPEKKTPSSESVWQEEAPPSARHADSMNEFFKRMKPTAVLFGSYWTLRYIAPLVEKKAIRIPCDLSVITSDHYATQKSWLGGLEPTHMRLPLEGMGRKLAEYARKLHEGIEVPMRTLLPVELMEGESVKTR